MMKQKHSVSSYACVLEELDMQVSDLQFLLE
jgi:hypothetical protein